nr:reverse transcriptase domain-containing protein [Tanacetum cinerariifolium]
MPPSIEDDDDFERDILFLERLLHDDPIPLPDTLDFSYEVRIFLPFFTYPVTSPVLLSSGSEDKIFDPGIIGFLELHQLDTFYNALNSKDQDSLNSVAGGNFFDKMPRECLDIIESKSKVRYPRNKPVVAKKSQNQAPAIVKAVKESCVTYGGAHSYQNCPATDGNVYRDNIQEFIYQASAVNYNQGNTSYRPPMIASTSSSGTLPSNTISNSRSDLKEITTRSGASYDGPQIPPPPSFLPKVVENEPEATKDMVTPPNNGISALMPNPKSLNSYPSRRNDERNREKANNQIDKFYQIFKDMSFEISFVDALILMHKFASTLKALIGNNKKLSEMARTLLNEHCSPVLLKKLLEKLGDPGKFLIPCDFHRMDECLALADLDASINLMPLRSFLKTERALIDVFEDELTLRVGKEAITFNLDQTSRYSSNYNDNLINRIDVIEMACEEYSQEVLKFFDVIASGNTTPCYDPIVSTTSLTLTPFRNSDFLLEEVDTFLALEDDPTSPEVDQSYLDSEGDILLLEAFLNDDPSLPPLNQGNYLPEVRNEQKICEAKSDKSSIDEPPEFELKDLPPHLEYAFLEGDDKLPVIITKDLSVEEKTTLIIVLKSHKASHSLETLRYQGPWVSLVHRVPKKGGFTVVENEENELISTRLVTGWRVCIDYRKLNEATHKDHFPLPFMDQMLERLAGNRYYCFLDGFSGYFQIPIDPKDPEKTTFTCPYGMFAYRRMPFRLCNAPCTFQRCMMAIFHDMIKKTMEVFMDDFSVFRNSFQSCLSHLEKMLKRCEDINLCLNWEKSHFMDKQVIVLGHKISKEGIEVDKAKVDVITKLPHPTTVKGIQSILGHAGFYRRVIKDFSKIARPMTRLLKKDTPFIFSKECVEAFQTLKRKLIEAPILIAPNWDMPFELMCDASDFAIGAVLGQLQDKHFRPIHYASKTMTEAESNYTTTEKEMLAMVYAFEKFQSYLIMNKSIMYTDHSALKYLFARKDSKARFLRWVLLLQEFTFKSSEGVYMASKPVIFSRLAIMDPPGDTMAQITQPRRGNKYILVAVDYLSKWVKAKALPTNDARVVYKYLKNLFVRFGTPRAIINDRGTHFCNDQFAKVMLKFGVTHHLATPYHPQTSGQVEVSNRGLKRILERTVGEYRASWLDKLDDALWTFRTTYKTPIRCTPYKIVYGNACHLPIELGHKAYWALKHANFDLQTAGDHLCGKSAFLLLCGLWF